jgi:D-alanyl-D-alanine carboxypeptidase
MTASSRGDVTLLQDALATGVCLGLPGISVSIANQDGILWSGADGFADVESRTPMETNDHSFCIGSITKTLVAVVLLQLVEEGKVDLDQTVLDYIPNQDSSDEQYKLVAQIPNTATATLRHVLCHQSGIPTWEFVGDWIRNGRGSSIMDPSKVWDKTETLRYLVQDRTPATGAPGEQFSYSNTNYTLLGLVIEHVTQNSAAFEIRSRLLEPLGLTSAYLESFETAPSSSAPSTKLTSHYHYATRHFVETAGISRHFQPGWHPHIINTTSACNLSTEWTAGGMVMSMPDLVTYTRALRDGQLLSPTMMQELLTYRPPHSDQIGDDSSGAQGKSLAASEAYYSQGICHHNKTKQNGLSYHNKGHGGLTLGFCSRMLWFQDQDLVLACATNVGLMHSGFEEGKSPWDLFVSSILLPAVQQFVGEWK